MFIKNISMRNILSYGNQAQTAEFMPLSILLGSNGSGKTNLLRIIKSLQNQCSEWPIMTRHDGTTGLKPDVVFKIEGNEETNGDQIRISYKGGNATGITIREMVSILTEPETKIQSTHMFNGKVRASVSYETNRLDLCTELKNKANNIIFIEDKIRDQKLNETVSDMLIKLKTEEVQEVSNIICQSDANHAELVVERTHGNPAGPKIVRINQNHGPPLPIKYLSDNTVKFLEITAQLVSPTSELIVIEDPAKGMHPEIRHTVGSILQQASKKTQIIITNSTTELLDGIQPDNLAVIAVEKRNRDETEITNISIETIKNHMAQLQASLAEVWTSGAIGACAY